MLRKTAKQIDKLLLFVLAFAVLIRLIGITHGFPFITHADEPALVRSAFGIGFNPNPAHFDWPHLHYYLNYAIYYVFIKFRGLLQFLDLRGVLEPTFPLVWRDPLIFYFISRVFSALLGAFTVIPVYLAGSSLFNRKVGLLSAVALAVLPFHVWHSHYALIDVPTTFWLAWGLYFSALILKSGDIKNYLLAGFFIGLSASTKYNGGLAAVMVPLAHFLRVAGSKDEKIASVNGFIMLVLSGLFAFLAFVLGTPYSILDYKTFIISDSPEGALWQFNNVGKILFVYHVKQFFKDLVFKLSDDFGYTFLITYVFILLMQILVVLKAGRKHISRDRKLWFLLLPSIFFFWYISGFGKTRSHYYIISYPLVSVLVGFVVVKISSYLNLRLLKLLLFLAIFSPPLFLSMKNAYIFARGDTRNILYDWMQRNVKQEDALIYESNSLLPVVEKFSENRKKKGLELEFAEGTSGYVLITDESADAILENQTYLMLQQLNNVRHILTVSTDLRTGPYIFVSSYDNEK